VTYCAREALRSFSNTLANLIEENDEYHTLR
jgi:hypothetical protein